MAKGDQMPINKAEEQKQAVKIEEQKLTPKEELKKKMKLQREKDSEKVQGIFRFFEVPGGSMSMVFKIYKDDEVERYDFIDGQTYSIPLGVAKHLNKSGWYPVHKHAVDEKGNPVQKIGQKVRRYGFQSLEFIDEEDLNDKKIITVENINY